MIRQDLIDGTRNFLQRDRKMALAYTTDREDYIAAQQKAVAVIDRELAALDRGDVVRFIVNNGNPCVYIGDVLVRPYLGWQYATTAAELAEKIRVALAAMASAADLVLRGLIAELADAEDAVDREQERSEQRIFDGEASPDEETMNETVEVAIAVARFSDALNTVRKAIGRPRPVDADAKEELS